MPIPIKSIYDADKNFSSGVDYSFLTNYVENKPVKKIITASDEDASLLFKIWASSEKTDEDSFRVSATDNKDVLKLKAKGFLSGGTDEVKFTKKGKQVIILMALEEPNKFENKRVEKRYNEILASMDKRNKPGYRIPKFASSYSNYLKLS